MGSLTIAMQSFYFWLSTILTTIVLIIPVLAWRFYFVDIHPTLTDRVRLKQRIDSYQSRVTAEPTRVTSTRRTRRSIRSGYAFAHQEGFGRLITSGTIMRKLPNPIYNRQNEGQMNGRGRSPTPSTPTMDDGRAPIQDLDTINL